MHPLDVLSHQYLQFIEIWQYANICIVPQLSSVQ